MGKAPRIAEKLKQQGENVQKQIDLDNHFNEQIGAGTSRV